MCDNLDETLLNLILEARKYPLKSTQRTRAVNKLIQKISSPGKLSCLRSKCPASLQGCYENIYEIAKNNLFTYIYQHPEKYDPSKGTVLRWVNGTLYYRFLDAIKEYNPLPQKEKIPQLSREVIEFIEEDPNGVFQGTAIPNRNHLSANLRYIALKIDEGYKSKELKKALTDLEKELEVDKGTIIRFYSKNVPQEIPKILSLDDVDKIKEIANYEKPPSQSEQVIEVIREDPGGIFFSRRIQSIRNKPKSSWQYIALRISEGYRLRELQDELGVSQGNISTFYRTNLEEFAPIIRKYLE